MKLPVAGTNERPDLCGPCGGRCCRNGPGIVDPADLGQDLEAALLAAFERDALGIASTCEGQRTRFFVCAPGTYVPWGKPRRKPERPTTSNNMPCANLTPAGCCLAWADRPRECRELEASPEKVRDGPFLVPNCKTPRGHDFYIDLWKPHQALLIRLAGYTPDQLANIRRCG